MRGRGADLPHAVGSVKGLVPSRGSAAAWLWETLTQGPVETLGSGPSVSVCQAHAESVFLTSNVRGNETVYKLLSHLNHRLYKILFWGRIKRASVGPVSFSGNSLTSRGLGIFFSVIRG